MTSIEQVLSGRRPRIDADVKTAILVDAALAELYAATAQYYPNDSSLLVFQNTAPFSHQQTTRTAIERAETLGQAYSELYKQVSSTRIGATTLVLGGENTLSPSSYSISALEYIGQLESENENLESRVSELEARLKEIQIYWPTIKKLATEYKSATARVESMIRDLTSKHGPRTGLEVAKQRDVLELPAEHIFGELE